MNVVIETIPHEEQRYPTVGDWYYKLDTEAGTETIHIKVSKLGDWRMEMLIAVHELAEVLMCNHDGISQQAVDDFDIAFESRRESSALPDLDAEPGDDKHAPYRKQHCVATGIERILCAELGVAWADYEAALNKLP
jgi:hypothetical protein